MSAKPQKVRKVTKWVLREISLVPIGADPGAKTRKKENMTTPQTTIAPPQPPNPSPIQTRAAVNQEIRALGQSFTIDASAVDALIDRQATVEEARAEIIEALRIRQDRPAPAPRVTLMNDNTSPDTFITRAGEALFARANPSHTPSDQARQFMGMTMKDMAAESLRMRSISTTGLSPADLVKRALTTSDFPQLLGNAAHHEVRAAYTAAPAVLKMLARQTTASDFRAKNKIALSEGPTLEKVNEKGEFKYGSLAESGSSYKIDTFGKIIGLSRQAIVNDDLGAFTSLSRIFGQSAAEFEAQFLVDLLESGSGLGPVMSDAKALFHVDHGNKSVAGAVPSEATFSTARTALRKQKGLTGKPINVPPKFILVPPDLETTTEKLLAIVQPNSAATVNPFGGKLALAVEARLSSATRWYMTSDTGAIDGLEFAYLAGEEGPQVDTRAGFEIDGLEIKCRLDFGAAFLDWRGWYTNAGA
jgi:Mu-like prophage major head subunit gpT